MVSFRTPSTVGKSVTTIDTFLGCDFTNSPANVDETKSPNAKNMIRDVPGKVRKCMGYQTIKEYDGRINGAHTLKGSSDVLIHAGTKMYLGDNALYEDMNDARSKSWQINDNLYIADGKALLVYDGNEIKKASEKAYIPTLSIAKSPSGGGTDYEALNLLQPAFIELFAGTESDKQYHLSFGNLDANKLIVKVLDSTGTWVEKKEGTDFSVNRQTGVVTFTVAPGKSPLTGEDNVSIQAWRTVDGYNDRINHCTIGTLYGVNGALDRLFLSGNPDYINYDWYSQQYNATYFPDIAYATLGTAQSAIVGYSIINNYLATHKDEKEHTQSIILRSGALEDSKPTFAIQNTLQGAGAIGKYTFGYLSTEPLFLTRLGVYAVTAQDITGEKYAQNRSFFLNGKLLEEENLEDAFAYVFKDFYWLCLNGVAYILDGLQPIQTDKSMPYATRQYAGFYRTNLDARVMWSVENDLYFGSNNGKVKKFYSDPESQLSYNDDGEPIECIWDTPDMDGKLFYKNKTFKYMAVRLKSAVATSIEMWVQKRGLWNRVKTDALSARYISFSQLMFSKFTFSTDQTQKIISTKLRVKKVDKARFRVRNNELNEPFGIFAIAFEYVENGNHKE